MAPPTSVSRNGEFVRIARLALVCHAGAFAAVWLFEIIDTWDWYQRRSTTDLGFVPLPRIALWAAGAALCCLPGAVHFMRGPGGIRRAILVAAAGVCSIALLTPTLSFLVWPIVFSLLLAILTFLRWRAGTREPDAPRSGMPSALLVYAALALSLSVAFHGVDWRTGAMSSVGYLLLIALGLLVAAILLIQAQVRILREKGIGLTGRLLRTAGLALAAIIVLLSPEIGVYTKLWRLEAIYLQQARISFETPLPGDVRIWGLTPRMLPNAEDPVLAEFCWWASHGDTIAVYYMPQATPEYESMLTRRLWGDWYY